MNSLQYIAFAALIDQRCASQPEMLDIIKNILVTNDTENEIKVFDEIEGNSLIKKWFICCSEPSDIIYSYLNNIDELAENCKIFLDKSALIFMADTDIRPDL